MNCYSDFHSYINIFIFILRANDVEIHIYKQYKTTISTVSAFDALTQKNNRREFCAGKNN